MINPKLHYSLLLLLALASHALAQEIDLTTGLPARATPHLQLTPLRAATGETRILWDASHGIYRDMNLEGQYSDLAELLALKNQFLEERNEGVLQLDLSRYDAMVVNLASNWYTPFTAEEVAAIAQFVEQGGNLLIAIDNYLTPLENLDQLAAVFGASFPRKALLPTYLYFTDFSDWPLFEGVQTLHFPWAGQIATTPPMLSGGRAPTGETAVAMGKYGAGHVLVVGDTNFCDNTFLPISDNQLFTEQLFDALSVVTVPTLSPVALIVFFLMLMVTGLLYMRKAHALRRSH